MEARDKTISPNRITRIRNELEKIKYGVRLGFESYQKVSSHLDTLGMRTIKAVTMPTTLVPKSEQSKVESNLGRISEDSNNLAKSLIWSGRHRILLWCEKCGNKVTYTSKIPVYPHLTKFRCSCGGCIFERTI